jgi:predicted enzyme related to lactoylglutathione lyase
MQILINIDVPDLDRAIRFYRDALGLRLARRLFSGSVAEMSGASSPIYLLTKAEGSSPGKQASDTRTYRRHWTPVHIDLIVDDLLVAAAKAQAAGATLESGPDAFSWGRIATFSDPFGHGFCLVQWSGKGYDEVAERK